MYFRIYMQVTSVNTLSISSNKYCNYKLQYNYPTFQAGYIGDIFIKKDLPIDKLKQFTLSEYRQLSKSEISSINAMIDGIIQNKTWKNASDNTIFDNAGHMFIFYKNTWDNFNDYLKYHDIVATEMKSRLEEDYGAGNFVVISIGRSVSSICKCLGYKIGEENIIQLPLSRASRFCYPYNFSKLKQEAIDILTNYMASMGMTKKAVQTSGKKYIFTDYRNFGATMAATERLFTSDRMFGNTDNMKFNDILKLLHYDYFHTDELSYQQLFDTLANLKFKSLSVVNMCDNLFRTAKSVYKPEDWDLLLKSFYFKFMDNEVNGLW